MKQFDFNGEEIQLANVPGSGVSRVAPGQRSGNPKHDTRSGKFGVGGGQKGPRGAQPSGNVDPLAFARMIDKVRLAARSMKGQPGVEDIEKWLRGKVANPGQVDPNGFLTMVQQQRMNDLVDAIDTRLRGSGVVNRGVRVSSSRGYLKGVLAGLEPNQIADVAHRLEAMGHSSKDVDRFLARRVDQTALESAAARREKLAASDSDFEAIGIQNVPETLELNALEEDMNQAQVQMAQALMAMADAQKNQPAPVIHVSPQVTVQVPPRSKKFVRDETGVITEVNEEDI